MSSVKDLRKQVDRYDRIMRGSRGYGFVDWDLQKQRMLWHGGLWEYLGYTDSDMRVVSDPERFLEFIHSEDRAALNTNIKLLLKGAGGSESIFRIKKKLGGYVWTEVRVAAVRDSENRVVFISGLAYDITKLKQTENALLLSEARHARILQSSNDGIWEWSAEHKGFHFSNRCWEHLGYNDHDDVVNQGVNRIQAWRKRIHEEDVSKFDAAFSEHLMHRKPFDVEYRILGKDEEWRWIRARGQMTYQTNGEPYRMSGTNMDITELKRVEEKVVAAKEAAEMANKAKSEFLSNMSHELRTPLNAILGFAQLFHLDGNLTHSQYDHVNEIKAAGNHLLQLIGDVLDLAKIESGRIDMLLENTCPVRIIKECMALVRAQADSRHIAMTADFNDLETYHIRSDAVRLKQVILNLLSNAIKYNYDEGRVAVSCKLTPYQTIQIRVEDSGRGITKDLHHQVFQPFNRLGAELTSTEGSGVGLVISRQLTEQMGGSLSFTSEENKGSAFWVDLPLSSGDGSRPEEIDLLEQQAASKPQTLPSLAFTQNCRILYVEDNPANQRLIQQMLGRFSQIDLLVVDEAFRGLYEARINPPDLILLDLNLPGMNGFEMLEVMRRDKAIMGIPVVAISANAMPHDIQKGDDAGFDYYLTKPVEFGVLIDVINRLFVPST